MSKLTTFDKIQKYFTTDIDEIRGKSKARNEVEMSPKEIEILMRARAAYFFWLEKPELPDSMVVDFLMREFHIEKTTAYNDMFAIKTVMGNINNCAKEFNRYTVIQMCKRAYKLAEELEDPKAMALAADKIGKYTKCDQNEADALPWDKILPPNFEPTADISVLDEKLKLKDLEATRQRLRLKYKGESIEEAEIIDPEE